MRFVAGSSRRPPAENSPSSSRWANERLAFGDLLSAWN
jgi:hypothetical protein